MHTKKDIGYPAVSLSAYFLETGCPTEPGSRLSASKPLTSPVSISQSSGIRKSRLAYVCGFWELELSTSKPLNQWAISPDLKSFYYKWSMSRTLTSFNAETKSWVNRNAGGVCQGVWSTFSWACFPLFTLPVSQPVCCSCHRSGKVLYLNKTRPNTH